MFDYMPHIRNMNRGAWNFMALTRPNVYRATAEVSLRHNGWTLRDKLI